MIDSPYQLAIYDFIQDPTKGSAVINGVAGCGKTTTIKGCVKRIPPNQKVRLLSYNVAIAKVLKDWVWAERLRHVTASTFHSVGYKALCEHFGMNRLESNDRKLYQLCRGRDNRRLVPREYEAFACELVSLAKGEGLGAVYENDPQFWRDIVEHHDLTIDAQGTTIEEGIRLARLLMARSIEAAESSFSIDFDDQLYLPVLWNLPIEQYDWVFIDEAQDTSPIRRAIAARLLKDGGRLVAVGDPKQAIYGFTGASHDAMDLIRDQYEATELPLHWSYRCPRTVVELAKGIVPYIEAAPEAIAGAVTHQRPSRAIPELPPGESAVLCRTTAPLIDLAFWLLKRGRGCRILGRDFGKTLTGLVEKMRAPDIDTLIERLQTHRERETRRLQAEEKFSRAQSVADRVDCLTTIIDNLPEDTRTLEALHAALLRLFDQQALGLTLSTVHKAKGLEWKHVAILRPDLMPGFWATQDWEVEQERNLMYVAYTRAQEVLYLLDDYDPDSPERIDRGGRRRQW